MSLREFLLYPEIPVEGPALQSQSMAYHRPSVVVPEVSASSRIGLIPVQSCSYDPTTGTPMTGYRSSGPPKLHIISVLDKEFYVTRIRGTPRFNPIPSRPARVVKKRGGNSAAKRRKEAVDAPCSEADTASYSDEGIGPEKSMAFDRSQENSGLMYPKASPRKVPAPRILSRFNPRHWAERPVLKSQVSTLTNHHQPDASCLRNEHVASSANALVQEQEQLTLFSPLSYQ